MNISRVLCPIDFSEASVHALEQALILAERSGARITTLHVVLSMLPGFEQAPMDAATVDTIDPADLTRRQERLAQLGEKLNWGHVPIDHVVVGGQPTAVILEQIAAGPFDLVVMGTHGTSGFRHLILGSVTEKVLRQAPCPVLTVPPRAPSASAAPWTHVLCAVDFGACSQSAVNAAAVLARDSRAKLTLLHVLEWPWHEPPLPAMDGIPPAQVEALLEYRRYLEQGAVDRLRALADAIPDHRDVSTLVRFGKPYVETLAAAEEEDADVLVLGVQGRNALDIGFFGSTTNHVVRAARCPVLTVRLDARNAG